MVRKGLYPCSLPYGKRTVIMYKRPPMWIAFGQYRRSKAILRHPAIPFRMIGTSGFLHPFWQQVQRDVRPIASRLDMFHPFYVYFCQPWRLMVKYANCTTSHHFLIITKRVTSIFFYSQSFFSTNQRRQISDCLINSRVLCFRHGCRHGNKVLPIKSGREIGTYRSMINRFRKSPDR